MDKNSKSYLKIKVKRDAFNTFRHSLPLKKELFLLLFDFLDKALETNDCDNTPRLTHRFLTEEGLPSAIIETTLSWLENHGGYCDCEVLANCEELFDYVNPIPWQTLNDKGALKLLEEILFDITDDFFLLKYSEILENHYNKTTGFITECITHKEIKTPQALLEALKKTVIDL